MKRGRHTIFPLPRYTLRKAVAGGGVQLLFQSSDLGDRRRRKIATSVAPAPSFLRPLGTDYEAALRVADTRLKLFDFWRTGGLSDMAPERAQIGTFDWLAVEYRASEKHQNLSWAVRKLREAGLSLVANHR